jgi:hypothetical protein
MSYYFRRIAAKAFQLKLILEWMKIGTPIVLWMLLATWFYLIKYFKIDGDLPSVIINHEIKLLATFKLKLLAVFFYGVGMDFQRY